MPYTVRYEDATNCILVKVEGELDLLTLQGVARDVSAAVEKYGCTCVLNDLRLAWESKAIEIYNMPKTAEQAGVNFKCKRALLTNNLADFRFLETVFINMGHQVRLFTSEAEAKRWLETPIGGKKS